MKQLCYSIILIGICFILLAACSKTIFDGGQYILIEKRVGMDNHYEEFNEVTEQKKVEKVRAILHSADWEKAKVEMERHPDYHFFFQFKNPNIEAKAVPYELWVSPDGETIELRKNNEYVKLNQEASSETAEILIGQI
ncbi:hypothetical protein [Lysinibacillus odysseyi]|uniref:YhfM-like domain-containing protein n=1 Tax=Lysinibacillus odysseyi 34hs-1 = NBRC 100172 TaxID=1220589 RepID=A0A0A3J4X7_9BACI|nr:hypothetical protein [Lysinibacillus odysseyi]KGR82112.1 hypothetical protein CD32_22740 [Lysinibacillus odysseyi 34hs-1 = NBRC 100172]